MAEFHDPGKTRRKRETRKRVMLAERCARVAITLGGVGTIAAVSMIFVFLAWVVLPLSQRPTVLSDGSFELAGSAPWAMGVDEGELLSWTLHRDGGLALHHLPSGAQLAVTRPFGSAPPSAVSFSLGDDRAVFGFADGTVRMGRTVFQAEFMEDDAAPIELRGLSVGESLVQARSVVTRTSAGQLRATSFELEMEQPLSTGTDSPVIRIDHSVAPQGLYLVTLQADGALRVSRERVKRNMLTGETTHSLRHALLRAPGEYGDPASYVGIGGLGQHAYALWADGRTEHWDLREWGAPVLLEERDLLEAADATVSAVTFIAGKQTLALGDSAGGISTWFLARTEGQPDADPLLVLGQRLEPEASAVVAMTASSRSRLLAASYASGQTRVFQATLGTDVLAVQADEATPLVLFSPKEESLIARGAERLWSWGLDLKYPEATVAGLFTRVHYEGYAAPEHSWQSSSASDDFEPKLGLMPLVFGTLKATLYSMLFGAPLALMAAIFTSEFLAPRLRSSIKSTVELMASLPSVVLGFIAALVIAPFVQGVLSTVLACFLTVPLAMLLGAHLWQLLPGDRMVSWSGWQRFLAIGLSLPIGVLLGMLVGPYLIEGLFFAGDLSAWLSGGQGSAVGGWLFLVLPLSALAVTLAMVVFVSPSIRRRSSGWSRQRVARIELIKFLLGLAATVLVALLLGLALGGAGMDPRGGMIDTYVQRNALVVGFAMGFAIVPIIYTLAEDALSEVPGHLREGSLGAGATQWQTAVRIVVPCAMSGLFSALMIGLGRAVGETMIVLMAAGNTPIMEWNVFNGFRTLSANIAVEMPEAVVGSAHYRTLFLAALVLFALTFVLNTAAELVRRHFRARTRAL